MYRHILIATDGSELAHRALVHGLALAKSVGARVTALTVTEPWAAGDMASRAERGDKHPVEDYEQEEQARASPTEIRPTISPNSARRRLHRAAADIGSSRIKRRIRDPILRLG